MTESTASMECTDSAVLSPREVVEKRMGLARSGNRAEEMELFAPDAVVEFPFAPSGVPDRFEGRDQIHAMSKALDGVRQQIEMRILEERSQLIVHETIDPDVVVSEIDVYVEVQATGEVQRLRQIHVYRVRDGKIVSVRDYFAGSTATMVQQALAS